MHACAQHHLSEMPVRNLVGGLSMPVNANALSPRFFCTGGWEWNAKTLTKTKKATASECGKDTTLTVCHACVLPTFYTTTGRAHACARRISGDARTRLAGGPLMPMHRAPREILGLPGSLPF